MERRRKRTYEDWKSAIREHKGIDVDNDSTYDYEGFYNENPESAWSMMEKESNAHFTDKYKTASHPTFSNESIYSGLLHEKHNPKGIQGGQWEGNDNDGWRYRLSKSQEDNDWDLGKTHRYLRDAERSKVPMLPEVNVTTKRTIFDQAREAR